MLAGASHRGSHISARDPSSSTVAVEPVPAPVTCVVKGKLALPESWLPRRRVLAEANKRVPSSASR